MSDPPREPTALSAAVLDASSLVRAALTPRSAARKLANAVLGRGLLVASASTLDEVERVLARPKFRRWLPEDDRIGLMRQIRSGAVVLEPENAVVACRDPSDNKYLEIALAAAEEAGGPGAVVIASDDQGLLALHPWQGIAVLKPEAVLELFGAG